MASKPHHKPHGFDVLQVSMCLFKGFRCTPGVGQRIYIAFLLALEPANFVPECVAVFKLMRLRRFQTVTRPMKPYRFENVSLLKAFSKRYGFNVGLDRCRVNERRNRIERDAVANETASV